MSYTLDELIMYKKALTTTEIDNIYKIQKYENVPYFKGETLQDMATTNIDNSDYTLDSFISFKNYKSAYFSIPVDSTYMLSEYTIGFKARFRSYNEGDIFGSDSVKIYIDSNKQLVVERIDNTNTSHKITYLLDPNIQLNKEYNIITTFYTTEGMKLYIDGIEVASNVDITPTKNTISYYRLGSS